MMKQKSPGLLLNELVESLSQASGACSQLTHAHQDPRWMDMRQSIDMAKEWFVRHATYQATKIKVKAH